MAARKPLAVNANGQQIPLPSSYAGDYIAIGGTSRRYAYAPQSNQTGITISRRVYIGLQATHIYDGGAYRVFTGASMFEHAAAFCETYAVAYPQSTYYTSAQGTMPDAIEKTSARAFAAKTASLNTLSPCVDAVADIPELKAVAAIYFTKVQSVTVTIKNN